MNYACFEGRLGGTPMLRKKANGTDFCTFTLRVVRQPKGEVVDHIPCVAWGGTARYICNHFHAEDHMLAQGEMLSRRRPDHSEEYLEFLVDKVCLTDGRYADANDETE